ncbi:hypothetical protein VFPPC_18274 [Pochonia chlamydosporia 170]|uniref:Uncharacterized protein n=1 Tax=Pochonia chlamydosporia 170 TaxID=1380566 RepID=A0A219APA1_METCM|nr:hypothetical protein VFPPC_18274 [Pochonia chlamydosporia 170]OWT42583.1 hypothetical protein VFPPC_18274 [Pochonia chlamydosporia 170]
MTSNRSALQVIRRPRPTIGPVHHTSDIRRRCSVSLMWVPAGDQDFVLGLLAKAAAKKAAMCGEALDKQSYQARSTQLQLTKLDQQQLRELPEGVGKSSKRIDDALPGKHTRELYDQLERRQSDTLVQLRTGMTRLMRMWPSSRNSRAVSISMWAVIQALREQHIDPKAIVELPYQPVQVFLQCQMRRCFAMLCPGIWLAGAPAGMPWIILYSGGSVSTELVPKAPRLPQWTVSTGSCLSPLPDAVAAAITQRVFRDIK